MPLPQQPQQQDSLFENIQGSLLEIANDNRLQKAAQKERDDIQLALVGTTNPKAGSSVVSAIEKMHEAIMNNNSFMAEVAANSNKSLKLQANEAKISRKESTERRRETIKQRQEQNKERIKQSFMGRMGLVQQRGTETPDGYRDEKGRFVRRGALTPTKGAAMAAGGLGLAVGGANILQALTANSDEMTASEQMRERSKGTAGTMGTGAGAVIGGLLGSLLGPLGTVAGAGLGAAAGGFIGNLLGGLAGPSEEDIQLEKYAREDDGYSLTAKEFAARRAGVFKEGGVLTGEYAGKDAVANVPVDFREVMEQRVMAGEADAEEATASADNGITPETKRKVPAPREMRALKRAAKKYELKFGDLKDAYLAEYPQVKHIARSDTQARQQVELVAQKLIEAKASMEPGVDDIKSPDDMMLEGQEGGTFDEALDKIKGFFGFETKSEKIERLEKEKLAKREELLTTSMNADIAATNAARDLELFQENAGEMVQVGEKFNPLEGTFDPVMGYANEEDQQRYEELQKKASQAKSEQKQATLDIVEYDLSGGRSSEGDRDTMSNLRAADMLVEMIKAGVDPSPFIISGPFSKTEANDIMKKNRNFHAVGLQKLEDFGLKSGVYFVKSATIRDYYSKWKAQQLSKQKTEKEQELQVDNDGDDLGLAEAQQPGFFESVGDSVSKFMGGLFGGGSDAGAVGGDTAIDESAGDVDMGKSKEQEQIDSMPPFIKRLFEENSGYDISLDPDGNWSATRTDDSGRTWSYNGDGSYSISDDQGVRHFDKDGKFLYKDSPTIGGLTERTFADGSTEQTFTEGATTQKTRDGQVVGEQFSAGGVDVAQGELARSGAGTSTTYTMGDAVSKYDSEDILGGLWESITDSEGIAGKLAGGFGSLGMIGEAAMNKVGSLFGGSEPSVVAPTTNNTTNNVVNNAPMPPPKSPKSEDESLNPRYG